MQRNRADTFSALIDLWARGGRALRSNLGSLLESGDGNHFVARANEKLTVFLELEAAIRESSGSTEPEN
jgi:hypothetical protein